MVGSGTQSLLCQIYTPFVVYKEYRQGKDYQKMKLFFRYISSYIKLFIVYLRKDNHLQC